jgi:predicted ATPase/signal transduction histidine kinase/tRNA A-37 threonylcarbamoyl transferase component Bud32
MHEIPGYDIHRSLKDGPTSAVYLARRESDDESVVLKVFKPQLPSPARIARFRHEFEIQRKLDTDGVVRALALESHPAGWVLVLADGGSEDLANVIARGHTLSLTEKLEMAIAAVDALSHLHEHHVIHKDINPSNLVWDPATRTLSIIDFGIATVLTHESPAIDRAEVLEGTLSYLAPEQTGRLNAVVDYRSDFYGLGATLYELFVGRRPFQGSDPLELVHAQIAKTPTTPNVAAGVPRPISDTVMKLLSKSAEDRYQSSLGIRHDLQSCLELLQAGGKLDDFDIGKRDWSERFLIPQRLYGREKEVEALSEALGQISGRGGAGERDPRLVLITGPAGSGKSALVASLSEPLASMRGYYCTGKYDQFQRGTPYSAVTRAFSELLREVLGEGADRINGWRKRLGGALGPNGRVVADVVPELEHLLGQLPEVAELNSAETANRFHHSFREFVRAFATPDHPLVIFLDDVQWADPASLDLIEELVAEDEELALLVIAAYRDAEVDATHPFSHTLKAITERGHEPQHLSLGPIGEDDIARMLAETVLTSVEDMQPVAKVVAAKTEGNPLFVVELVNSLHADGLFVPLREEGRWDWDLDRVQSMGSTENVLQLMIAKIERLSKETQNALQDAAILGTQFDLATLAHVRDSTPADVFAALVPAVDGGMVFMRSELSAVANAETSGRRSCRFFHDRVQQGAYALVKEERRERTHLRIGRFLLASEDLEGSEGLFAATDHLNRGRRLIDDGAERLRLAQLNLEAGSRARASSAHEAAVEYLQVSQSLLPDGSWESRYELTMRLHKELAAAEYSAGNHDQSSAWAAAVVEHARTDLERAAIADQIARQLTMSGDYAGAIASAQRGLDLLGVPIPEGDMVAAMGAEFGETMRRLGGRDVASLLDHPVMEDEVQSEIAKLVMSQLGAAFYVDPIRYSYLIFKLVNLALEHGHPREGQAIYSFHGHLLSAMFGQPKLGQDFCQLSLKLAERAGSLKDICTASFITANFVLPWAHPLVDSRTLNDSGFRAGLASGDFLFAGYILTYEGLHDLFKGRPLEEVAAEMVTQRSFNERTNNIAGMDTTRIYQLATANLRGQTSGPESFDTPDIGEAEMMDRARERGSIMGICFFNVLKTQAMNLYRMPRKALEASAVAEELKQAVVGAYANAEHCFHTLLALVAVQEMSDEDEQPALEERIEPLLEQLEDWCSRAPQNLRHKLDLVHAERARVAGRLNEAVDAYELAIDGATRNRFPRDVALANELCARHWLARDRDILAGNYMNAAHYGYRAWGAGHKLTMLEDEFKWLRFEEPRRATLHPGSTYTGATATDDGDVRFLDFASVIKASQAISSEMQLDTLLRRLMELVVTSAGARRGVLLLDEGGALTVQAVAELAAEGEHTEADLVVQVQQGTSLTMFEDIAHSIVNSCVRMRESVIVNDAPAAIKFARDPYILARQPKSILCAPLTTKGQVVGFLYLENDLATGVFTESRVELLQMLAGQFAISFENANLYNEMELKIADRTSELRDKNAELEHTLADLRSTQARLIHAEKMASLGKLTAGIAHEINNPLNFVNNFAEISEQLLEEIGEQEDEELGQDLADLKSHVSTIRKHGQRATGIVKSMLQHASGATGRREAVDLNKLIGKYLSLVNVGQKGRDERSHIELVTNLDESVGLCEVIPQEFSRVMVNLLNNARDAIEARIGHSPDGEAGRVSVETHREGERVLVRVSDNGMGIAPNLRTRVFEPFFTTKSGTEGTGLGLSICYDIIVHSHSGSIAVLDTPGGGATVEMSLIAPDKSQA